MYIYIYLYTLHVYICMRIYIYMFIFTKMYKHVDIQVQMCMCIYIERERERERENKRGNIQRQSRLKAAPRFRCRLALSGRWAGAAAEHGGWAVVVPTTFNVPLLRLQPLFCTWGI